MRLIDADKLIDDYNKSDGTISDLMELILDAAEQKPPTNDPLTLEELREMDGEPVWCESEHRPDGSGWFIVDASALLPHEFIAVGRERGIPCAGIDTSYWTAYRRKPEEGMP